MHHTSKTSQLRLLRVRTAPGSKTRGILLAGSRVLPCALGRSGIGTIKKEGDGFTPRGRFRLLSAMLRVDRVRPRTSRLPLAAITAHDGWCDEPGHGSYNQPVHLPFEASHEKLARDDHLYDNILVPDFNMSRRMSLGGSAIFFHLAHDDYRPTEGCVAVSKAHMEYLWPRLGPQTVLQIE